MNNSDMYKYNDEIRNSYSIDRLQEVIGNAHLYDSEFVECCKAELHIREEAKSLKEQVKTFSDTRIDEVLQSPDMYSLALFYCCQRERNCRINAKKVREYKKTVEIQSNVEEEKNLGQTSPWKKYQWLIYAAVMLIFILLCVFNHPYYEKVYETEVELAKLAHNDYVSDVENTTDNDVNTTDYNVNATNNVENATSHYERSSMLDVYENKYGAILNDYLKEEDINDFSKEDLRILRNWIYAKHGYKFKSDDMREFFGKFSWYKGMYNDVSGMLTEMDRTNVAFIKRHE